MNRLLRLITSHPLLRWLIWIGFAVVFYRAGETFTIWLLEPEHFAGDAAWFWVVLLPVLVPAFFVINRYCGCASGACRMETDKSKLSCPPGH